MEPSSTNDPQCHVEARITGKAIGDVLGNSLQFWKLQGDSYH